MKKLAIVTATRAEYGLLLPVIMKLKKYDLDIRLVVTGMHLSHEFGMTVNEIEKDNICIDKKIDILLSGDSPAAVSKSMGIALISFADYFEELKPDALLLLGDRYELLPICCAAANERIPIIHLYGGETTEGAVDEKIRHCLTKFASLHFTANELYRKRVIQMGENPETVFSVGAMGTENAVNLPKMSIEDLENSLGCELHYPYAVLTFHPVTLENCTAEAQTNELISALDEFPELTLICTKANSDADGRIINQILKDYSEKRKNVYFYDSLGSKRYLSAVAYSSFVIGNSSSGISEAPSLGVPTVNIGDRQKGRMKSPSVIDCLPEKQDIVAAITKAMSSEYINMAEQKNNPYFKENTSDRIAELTYSFLSEDKLRIKKKFFDI